MGETKTVGYKDILKIANCRKLLFSNLINRFGDSIDAIAFTWLVYQLTGSATWSAIIFGLNQLPGIVVLPLAGAWVEGKNKKKIIVYTDLLRGLVIAGFVVLYYLHLVNPFIMAGFTLLITTIESLNEPAAGAFVPEIVQGDYYTVMQSMKMTVAQVVNLIGMSLAGIIIAAFGVGVAMLIDVATFFIGAFIILFIDYSKCKVQSASISEQDYMTKLKDGFKYMKGNGTILYFCLTAVMLNFVLSPLNSLLTPLVSSVYMKDADFLSIVMAGQWIGAIIASLVLPKVISKISFDKAVGCLGAIEGVACLLLSRGALVKDSMSLSIVLATGSMFIIGLTMSIIAGMLNVELVKKIDTDYMARCSSAFNAVGTASLPVGTFFVTLATVRLNCDTILLFTGVLGIIIFGGIYFVKKVSNIKEKNVDAKQSIREHQNKQEADASYPGAAG